MPHGCNRITLLRHSLLREVLKLYGVKGSSIWPICVPLTLFDKMKKGKKGLFSMALFSFSRQWDHLAQCVREMNTRIMSNFDR